jgi:cell division ATPase FtsA
LNNFSIAVNQRVAYNISMSLFSFLKKNKESYSLVINIGSGSVSGAVVKFTEAPGEILTSYNKEIIPFQEEISVPKHLELMKSSLDLLVKSIQKTNTSKIDRIFYIFSSPWSISQTKIIKIKEIKTVKITDNYLNKIISEHEKKFQAEVANSGKIIEKKIIQIKINGYVVDDFIGKNTKDLEIAVLFTVVPEDILLTIENVVSKVFHINNIWCHSLSLASSSVIRNLFPQKEDFIHIDVSEEVTDISIIENNILLNSASIPFGRNDFIRELSKTLGVSAELADSQIRMHCAKHNDELAAMKLSVAMDKAAFNWLAQMTGILNGFKDNIYVPDSIFLGSL